MPVAASRQRAGRSQRLATGQAEVAACSPRRILCGAAAVPRGRRQRRGAPVVGRRFGVLGARCAD
eukprot:6988424-Lingulodinium_polyedra.AAC.1